MEKLRVVFVGACLAGGVVGGQKNVAANHLIDRDVLALHCSLQQRNAFTSNSGVQPLPDYLQGH